MNTSLKALSPAKLNLFLHITGRRADGYHELQTLFQLLDWGDDMHFSINNSGQVTLDCPDLGIPEQDNLIVKAAQLIQGRGQGAHISVHKRIPAGGGLGGGSSNAATTLLALNALWGCEHSREDLAELGSRLGADVPVFALGHSAWAEGIGERLSPITLPERWFFVLFPGCEVATGKIFSHGELTRDSAAIKLAAFFEGGTRNDCENVVRKLYPEVDNALKWLDNFGDAKLTGTGASVFASFATRAEAEAVLAALPENWEGIVAKGVNHSPTLNALP